LSNGQSSGSSDRASEQERGETTTGRRTFLRRAAVAGGVAWVAPTVLSTPAGAQPVSWYVEIDPNCNVVTTTLSSLGPDCEPAGWIPGQPAPVNGVDLDWSMTMNNGDDCSQGFVIAFDDPGAIILGAVAEETCLASSPPGEVNCITGTPVGLNGVSFPDNFVPEQCLYDVFRILLQTGS
jgi:hypothetical protein